MAEEVKTLRHEQDFCLEAAIDLAALAVQKGPVALCSAFGLLLQENKRLKTRIEVLERELRAAQKIISLSNTFQCNCLNAELKKRVHVEKSSEIDTCIPLWDENYKKFIKNDVNHHSVPETEKRMLKMENSVGGDSGIQLSFSQSFREILLPQLSSSEGCSEFKQSSSRILRHSSDSHQSSLLRKRSKAVKSSMKLGRNSFCAVELKSVCRRTSLDYSSDETILKSHLERNAPASCSLTKSCISEKDDDAASTHRSAATAAGELNAVTVVAQVHQSAYNEEFSGSQPCKTEEQGSIKADLDSSEEIKLESRCPLFGCLCKACSELRLLDPGLMFYIDDRPGDNKLAVGTELLVSIGDSLDETAIVSVVYVGHAAETSLPPDYRETNPPLAFPLGIVALFPDGKENFVPMTNVLYAVNNCLEHDVPKEVLHISEDQGEEFSEDLVVSELERGTYTPQDQRESKVSPSNEENVVSVKYLKSYNECKSAEERDTRPENPHEKPFASEIDRSSCRLQASIYPEECLKTEFVREKTIYSSSHIIASQEKSDNFNKAIPLQQQSIEFISNERVSDSITLKDNKSRNLHEFRTQDNHEVVEAVNSAFVSDEEIFTSNVLPLSESHSSSPIELASFVDGGSTLQQCRTCAHNLLSDYPVKFKAPGIEKLNTSLNSCKNFRIGSNKNSNNSPAFNDLYCTFCNSRSMKCSVCNSGKNYTVGKCSSSYDCKNTDGTKVLTEDEWTGFGECKRSGCGEVGGEMSQPDPTNRLSTAIQPGSKLYGSFENHCFEDDKNVNLESDRLADLEKSSSCHSSSMPSSLKNSLSLNTSYVVDFTGEELNPTGEKAYANSVLTTDVRSEMLPRFNGTLLAFPASHSSASLSAEDTYRNEPIHQLSLGSFNSFDFRALNESDKSRKQMPDSENNCSLSDNDVRISIRSTSPENISRASKDDIFNRTLKLIRRWSFSMAESVDRTDVSHV